MNPLASAWGFSFKMTHGIFWEGDINNSSIPQIIDEIFIKQIYLNYFGGKKDLTILDVGAFTGIFALYASPFASKIYSIEPSNESFELLKKTIEFNKLEKVSPFKLAITNVNGRRMLHDSRNKTARSIFTAEGAEGRPPEEVEVMTIEKFMNDNKIEHVDFLKLDPEGAETEIVSGEPFKNVASRIDTILVENHYFSGRNPHQLVEALRNNGYKLERIDNNAEIWLAKR